MWTRSHQSARHIDGIRVQLKVTQSIAVLDSSFNYVPTTWENSTLMERTLEIGVPMRLSKLNPHREASQSVARPRSPWRVARACAVPWRALPVGVRVAASAIARALGAVLP